MLASTPDFLKQKFEYLSDRNKNLAYNKLQSQYKTKYLTLNDGLTSFLVSFRNFEIIIYEAPAFKRHSHFFFDKRDIIKDVEYLPDKKLKFRVVIAGNCAENNSPFIALLFLKNGKLHLEQKTLIMHEITSLKVLQSDYKSELRQIRAPSFMQTWPHVIAVGTEKGHCYLTYINQSEPSQGASIFDCLAFFHQKNKFKYCFSNSKRSMKTDLVDLEVCAVTAIGYLRSSAILIVGFKFGGVMVLSFEKSLRILSLKYVCSTPVSHIAFLNVHEDSKNSVYFGIAYDRKSKEDTGLKMALYSIIRKKRNSVSLKLLHNFETATRWLSFRTLYPTDDPNISNGFASKVSKRKSSGENYHLFLAYMTNENKLMGGLFDLSVYSWCKFVPRVVSDGTVISQNPFLSYVWPCDEGNFDLTDLVVDVDAIHISLSHMSSDYQLFYSSNYEIPEVYGFSSNKVYSFSISSIKSQILGRIADDVQGYVEDPRMTAEYFTALGLGTDRDMNPLHNIFSCLIRYNQIDGLLKFIRTLKNKTEMLSELHSSIRVEVEWTKKKMDEATPLSAKGQLEYRHAMKILPPSIEILHELFLTCESEDIGNDVLLTRDSTIAYFQYYSCIARLIGLRMLPLGTVNLPIYKLMSDETIVRRREVKQKGDHLHIDVLISEVLAKDASGLYRKNEQYPPSVHFLLASLLFPDLSKDLKRRWLLYFFIHFFTSAKIVNEAIIDKKSICDDVEAVIGCFFKMIPDEVQSIYDFWAEDYSRLSSIDTGVLYTTSSEYPEFSEQVIKFLYVSEDIMTKDLATKMEISQEKGAFPENSGYLRTLLRVESEEDSPTVPLVNNAALLGALLMKNRIFQKLLERGVCLDGIMSDYSQQSNEEVDEASAWLEICSHLVRSRLKTLGITKTSDEADWTKAAARYELGRDADYEVKKICNNLSSITLSLDFKTSELEASDECTDCISNKETSLFKCCNSLVSSKSLAVQEAEFLKNIEFLKTVVNEEIWKFQYTRAKNRKKEENEVQNSGCKENINTSK